MRHQHLIAGALACTLVVACDSVRDTDGGPLSKDEFVERANEICADTRTAIAQIPPPSLADPIAVEQAMARRIELQRGALRDLRDLQPPARDRPGVRAWLRDVNRAIEELERLREGLEIGDRAQIADASEAGESFTAEAEEFADAYGVAECSTAEPDERE